jgi:hypothetical protein
MGKENFQSMGFPDVPATRKAIIEPELLDVPTNEAGFRLARMDTTGRIIENPNIPSDYPAAMAGQVAGKLDVPTDYKDIFQSHFDARRLLSQPESGDYYSFSRAHPIQYADEEWLNRLMEQRLLNERKIKEGGYKKGGTVDIDKADARLSKAIEERMSGSGMAKGGGVDIKSADARLQAAIDARMGMADGGEAGFKQIQFMDKGGKAGKLAKGVTSIGKRLLADEAPAINRDANLQKFLSKSQVKDPVFHASKADVKQFSPKHRTGVSSMGHHFGTAEQANFRTTQYDFDSQTPNIGKYHLNIENPLEVSHMASFAPDHLAEQLMDMNLLKPEVYDALSAKHNYDNIALGDELVKVLRKNGYDGLKYANEREGEGFSYVPLNATQIKSAIGNRGTYDIEDADITKAEGGGAFKKLEFMADGGKIVKGAMNIGKRLMADNSLPALEREANLKKFLEPSKTPMRLYHGTTATEGGKRNEAIRRIKPSKEGSLGSGVYLTPNTAQASGYSGIPNDEAIISMLGSKYHQDTGLKAMNQRNSGELLPAQEGGNMLPVYAQLRNPLVIEGTHNDPMIEALVKLGVDEDKAVRMVERAYEEKGYIGKQVESRARAAGYDGLMQYRDGDLSEVVSYNPNAVKSATGNQGTYDINEPDLSKAEGGGAFKKLQFMDKGGKVGKVASGVSKVGKRLLADPEKKIIEPPSIIIPSKIGNVKDAMRKRQGEFGARRVERAADEIPNLERMYQEEALKQAFGGDNAKAMMTIDPNDFEKYAMPIPMDIAKNKMYFTDIDKNRTPNMREVFRDSNLTDSEWMALDNREKALLTHQYMRKYNQEEMNHEQYLKHLAGIDDGFSDVPFLQINKQEQGLPLTPFISGHEGRHRNRALAGRGEEKSLVQLIPRSELREPFPRRSQEEYLEALKKELEMTGNKVRPESEDVYGGGQIQQIKRGLIELPDLYADGGAAFKTLQFKDAQHFDGGGIAIPEMNNSFEGSSREPLLTEKDWANIKRNAPEVYEWAKQNVKDEASQLKTARGVKDFALRTGAQYLGGIPDLINLGLMGVDALADTSLSSEKPWFGSEQYIEALKKSGAVGENEFPIAETVAGVLAPAGLIKKGVKQLRKPRSKQEPKKRRGGLTAMSR